MNVRKIGKGKQMKKKTNPLKKKTAILAIVGTMAISGAAGFSTTVKASNTEDKYYTYGGKGVEYTSWRAKEDYTKVYVYPTSGGSIQYTVQGLKGSKAIYRSNTHSIPVGVQASITNYVRENGNHKARLKKENNAMASTIAAGWWSPDSTRNYTVYD